MFRYQGGAQYASQTVAGLQNNQSPVQKTVPTYKQSTPSTPPLKPLNISTVGGNQSPNLYQSPTSPNLNQSPAGFRPATPSINRPWASVQSPTHQTSQPPYYQQPPQQYQPVVAQTYQPSSPLPTQQSVPQQYQPANQLYNQPVAAPSQVCRFGSFSFPNAYKKINISYF